MTTVIDLPAGVQEFRLHKFVVSLLRLSMAKGCVWYHCPNGEKRNPQTGAKLKKMGVRPGVPDICIVLPGGQSAFLELKAPGGRLSPSQRVFREDAETAGARYAVATNQDEAIDILAQWGAIRHKGTKSRLRYLAQESAP